jgi:hypothetical protein
LSRMSFSKRSLTIGRVHRFGDHFIEFPLRLEKLSKYIGQFGVSCSSLSKLSLPLQRMVDMRISQMTTILPGIADMTSAAMRIIQMKTAKIGNA